MRTSTKKSILFIGLTFFITWSIACLYYFLLRDSDTGFSIIPGIFYMSVPMCVAILVQKFIYKEQIRNTLGISFRLNRWFLYAWLLPPVMVFATFSVSLLLPGVKYDPAMEAIYERLGHLSSKQIELLKEQAAVSPISPVWFALLSGMVAGITVNAIAAFGEELGWRGFLHNEWKRMGFWKSSTLIGIVWGIWHAPFMLQGFNYPEHRVIGVFMMIAWCALISPIFSYVRIRSNSTIAVCVLHGTLNGTGILSVMMIKGGGDLLIGPTGLAGFSVLLVANAFLLCHNLFWARQRVENCI